MTHETTSNDTPLYQQIVERCWSEPEFKARLIADPRTVLAELGLEIPNAMHIEVCADTPDHLYLHIPMNPDQLSDEDLDAVAGGATYWINGVGFEEPSWGDVKDFAKNPFQKKWWT